MSPEPKAERIVKVGKFVKEDEATGEERDLSFLKSYAVFNVAEIEGATERLSPAPAPRDDHTENPQAVAFLSAIGADVRHGGNQAFYATRGDFIQLPHTLQFKTLAHYYATSFHEHGHWTGNESRLNRTFGKRFGDHAYALEELTAELTAAFLCAEFGVTGELRHAGYLQHWAKACKANKQAIFAAAARASDAVRHLKECAGMVQPVRPEASAKPAPAPRPAAPRPAAPMPAPAVDHAPDGREQFVIPGAERHQPAAKGSQLALF